MSTSTGQLHPLLGCAHAVGVALKDVAHVDPAFMTVAEKKAVLLELDQQIAQLTERQLRVLGSSADVAFEEGMTDVGVWLAHHARLDRTDAARRLRLACELNRMPVAAAALWDGTADVAQVSVIARAVGELPDEVDPDVRVKAEEHLVAKTPSFAPQQLRTLGRRVLEVVAPGVADDHERRLLVDQENGAYRRTTLRTRANGDGTTEIHASVWGRRSCPTSSTPTRPVCRCTAVMRPAWS